VGRVDGTEFEGGKAENTPLTIGSGQFIPGFEEQLTGVKTGDKKTITVTFPEDYPAENLKGKEAEFDVTVHQVKVPTDTKIDDEFAKNLGLEGLDKLKELLRGQLEQETSGLTRTQMKRQLLDTLAAGHDFAVPQGMVEAEFEQIWAQLQQEAAQSDDAEAMLKEMDDELRSALVNKEFRLHYQPLVDSTTRMIVSAECLMRWDRPDGKRIGPNVFIPVAEESGLINSIGLWVLRQACCDALEWDGISLSVNISAAQLRNPEFPIQLGHILEETGFPAGRLELEITETCLVLDPVVAERSLAVIRGFGVRIALDDFGTGYASFGFLRQFRFEKLKLDRSLVVQAGQDDGSRAMMLSSITVARAMKMGVTAEGVETEEQADMVRAAGCDQIQGWLYFKAMPSEEITQHLGKPIGLPLKANDRESKVA